jgi:hypothetical protein
MAPNFDQAAIAAAATGASPDRDVVEDLFPAAFGEFL